MNYKLKKFNIYEKCINCKKNCILNIILLKFTFKKFLINLNFEKIIRKSFLYLCLVDKISSLDNFAKIQSDLYAERLKSLFFLSTYFSVNGFFIVR